ncbi:DUF2194 domain-containing protein [Azotosporobacter soli]|uniref:DUF2194 domain-containing protein n=1 Tax=Azotosporobacter soli TaxID=3055040 RepID=UPI0031FEECCB
MPHRNMFLVLLLVFSLGLFFQYNRSDGFLRLFSNQNTQLLSGQAKEEPPLASSLPRERYLIVYDPADPDSLRLGANVEQTLKSLKKDYLIQSARQSLPEPFPAVNGIILVSGDLEATVDFDRFRAQVDSGLTLYLLTTPVLNDKLLAVQTELGIAAVSPAANAPGGRLLDNLLLGGKDFSLPGGVFDNSSLGVQLTPEATAHMLALDNTPLVWERAAGRGHYVVFNGSTLSGKQQRGLLTGLLSLGQPLFAYPVVASKTMCIDDFPAPIPEGKHAKIYDEYRLSTPEFFRQIWWPDMLSLAAKYDIRYTGLIIETYNTQQSAPFAPEQDGQLMRNNLILYGRELLKSGGELGVHGYNHQPLITDFNPQYSDYTPWPDKASMAASLSEVRRYVKEAYPEYQLKTYVPPSNMLSPEGRQALTEALPDLAIIASVSIGDPGLRNTYYQDYKRAADGILEMPRLSSDYNRHPDEDWAILNGITYMGVFSHFVHPDNIFYPENEQRSWRDMYEGLDSLLKMVQKKYAWLRSCTLSQSGEYFSDYLALDYRLVPSDDGLDIYCWGFRQDACFVLRSAKKIRSASGCSYQRIDEQSYLITLQATQAHLAF